MGCRIFEVVVRLCWQALAHNDNFHTYSIAIQDGWIVWMMPFVSLYLTGFSFNARVPIDEVHFKVFCSEDGIDWKLCLDSKEHGNIEEDEDVCCEHRHVKWLFLGHHLGFAGQLLLMCHCCWRPQASYIAINREGKLLIVIRISSVIIIFLLISAP